MSTTARRRLMRDFKVRHYPGTIISSIARPQDQTLIKTSAKANANRSSSWCLRLSHCRQCHDMVSHRLRNLLLLVRSLMNYRNAVIIGPADTPFEDGTFRLVMHFEEQYPNKPPGVKFISQMFHPNVYGTGELCLDILQNRWSPTYDVAAILTSIQRYTIHPPFAIYYSMAPLMALIQPTQRP